MSHTSIEYSQIFVHNLKPSIRKVVKASTKKLEICKKRAEKDKSLIDKVVYGYIELGEINVSGSRKNKSEKI